MPIQPKVSILMPVYNEENFLETCLDSVIDQEFQDWELIAVDDFSTDNSFNILGQFCKKDPRIRAMQNSSKGIIPALKLAFANSNGHLITRMDADDIMPARKLKVLANELIQLGPGNIVGGKVKYFSDHHLQEGYKKYEQWINLQNYYSEIYKECTLPSACWMAYRTDLKNINAFKDSRYPEDYDLLFKFYHSQLHIQGIKEVLHFWRDHPARASRTDPNYLDQTFFQLKVSYFFEIDWDKESTLIIWGAGRKGKALVKEILSFLKVNGNYAIKSENLTWVTDNPNKVGKEIYGITLSDTKFIEKINHKQVIVAISDQNFQKQKTHLFQSYNLQKSQIFEFC